MNDRGAMWHLSDNSARLSCGPLVGQVLFGEAGAQFVLESWKSQPVRDRCSVFHVGFAERQERQLKIVERYIRGDDLVASYEKTGSDEVAPQIYWRAAFDSQWSAASIELIVSVQTDLLDSRPQFSVASCAAAGPWFIADDLSRESWRECTASVNEERQRADSDEQLCLFRSEQLGMSFAQMVHPSDFVSLRVESTNSMRTIESSLFPERLEKGVIRRGRVRGWFLPREHDQEAALALARQFIGEPLPLTT